MDTGPKLTFKVAPHAVQDLGSNLYTTFPKVLAEFVANAYDADASYANIICDFKRIDGARKVVRNEYELEVSKHSGSDKGEITSLGDRCLPETICVQIEDDGRGMNVDELNERFLWTARKRRDMPDIPRKKKRPLMGRKGLGKLAGFGAARVLEVITKREEDEIGVKLILDFDRILQNDQMNEIPLETSWDNYFGEGKGKSGTCVRLKRLGFEAVKSRSKTVARDLSEHFEFIDRKEFSVKLNGHNIVGPRRQFAYAWPSPSIPKSQLVRKRLATEVGEIEFGYRIRFRGDRKALPGQKRGVRVYAHKRLASAPSLFDADTNMHGFRMTDYMDGVVDADFIDEQSQDYISTDRESIRWDTPLLGPLREFISNEIKEACKAYQAVRDKQKNSEVLADEFTLRTIDAGALSRREKSFVKSMALRLARLSKRGVEDASYKEVLPQLVRAVGHGELFTSLTNLAESETADLMKLIHEVVKLNRAELDGSTTYVRSRIKAIEVLEKEVRRTPEDGGARNERAVQELFEEAPWLMDPHFKDYLTADKSLNTTLKNLEKHLDLTNSQSDSVLDEAGRREPDFVFLLSDDPLRGILIVELKAPNKFAEVDDIIQLREYIDLAKQWLATNGHGHVVVHGELLCTPPPESSSRRTHTRFHSELRRMIQHSDHRVRSYTRVLEDAKLAHANILEIAKRIAADEFDVNDDM